MSSLWAYQGGYDEYSRIIRNWFRVVLPCFSSVCMIYDGPAPHKSDVRIDRGEGCLQTAFNLYHLITAEPVSLRGLNGIIFPYAIQAIIDQVLSEFDHVEKIFTLTEADMVIALEARKRGAYVIANDSDFYVFDIPGYIPLQSISVLGDQFSASVYRREKLLKAYRINSEYLPVICSILSNDVLSDDSLIPVYTHVFHISPPKHKQQRIRRPQFEDVAKWATTKPSLQDIVDALVRVVPYTRRGEFIRNLTLSLLIYTYPEAASVPLEIPAADPAIKASIRARLSNGTWNSSIFALWTTRQIWYYPRVEGSLQQDSWDIVTDVKSKLYALVCGRSGETQVIQEFARVKNHFAERHVNVPDNISVLMPYMPRALIALYRNEAGAAIPSIEDLVSAFVQFSELNLAQSPTYHHDWILPSAVLYRMLSRYSNSGDYKVLSAIFSHVVCAIFLKPTCIMADRVPPGTTVGLSLTPSEVNVVSHMLTALEAYSKFNTALFTPLKFPSEVRVADGLLLVHMLRLCGTAPVPGSPVINIEVLKVVKADTSPKSIQYRCNCATADEVRTIASAIMPALSTPTFTPTRDAAPAQ